MEEKNISRDFFILSVLTVISVTVWIVIDVYRTLNKTEDPKISSNLLETINPKIGTSVLDRLEEQKFYEISEYQPLPSPEIEPAPTATSEGETF